MFSRAVRVGNRLYNWKTKPTVWARKRSMSFMVTRSWPLTSTRPLVGRSNAPSMLSSVDLPLPEGPITATISPRRMARSTPSSARTSAPSP